MSKWPMRGHFRYLSFKTFPMTLRTPQCEVFWPVMSNSKHSGVPEDSKSPTLGVGVSSSHFTQNRVATAQAHCHANHSTILSITLFHFVPHVLILSKCQRVPNLVSISWIFQGFFSFHIFYPVCLILMCIQSLIPKCLV